MGWTDTVQEIASAERARIDAIDQNISSRSMAEKIKDMADILDAARHVYNPCKDIPLCRILVSIKNTEAVLDAIRMAKEETEKGNVFEIHFTP